MTFFLRVDAVLDRHEPNSRWVHAFRDSGYEASHWSAKGQATATDAEICAHAREHGYVILRNDLDFPQILAHTGDSGPSVLLLRGEPLVPEVRATALLRAVRECEAELVRGAIVTLDWPGQPRARVLPLG